MAQFTGKPVRAFVVWEPVLLTDWSAPSVSALSRISDSRATQFWDKERLISHSMGEHDRHSVVWDHIAVYSPGEVWGGKPPPALYHGGPVVRVIAPAQAAVAQALRESPIEVHTTTLNTPLSR